MKQVVLRTQGKHQSRTLFKTVTENSPTRAINVGEMRKRVKLLDVIEGAEGDILLLEDTLHATLKQALDEFPWSVADAGILQIIDDVFDAQETLTSKLKAVEKAN